MTSMRRLRTCLSTIIASLVVPAAAALTPPSASDGPVKLLGCVVTPTAVLEAHVDNQSDDAMECSIRCTYELGERKFNHHFNLSIPARFTGRLGRFDTSNGKAGNYSGDIGTCKKASRS